MPAGRQMRLGLYGEDLITLTQRWQLTVSGRYDRWRDSGGSSVTRSLSTGVVVPRFFNERVEEAFNPRIALLFHASENLTFRAAVIVLFERLLSTNSIVISGGQYEHAGQ
jgi:outer membrane receptor protein involved in Fe transport